MSDDSVRVTTMGKQIKLDGEHLADARDPEAAKALAICMNRVGSFYTTPEEQTFLEEFLA